jgi:TonB-linked SusC/RagA family outer membrane protein
MKRIYTISGLLLLFTFFTTAAFAQNITVKGKVTDAANGEALIGVTVAVKGTTTGTQTDVNGAYSLSVPSNATLQVSYIGYTTQDIAIGDRTNIDIKLQGGSNLLEQVVVVGYGTQRKIDVTGSVAQVKGEEISKQSSINPISSLQGKVAGVQITNSGAPGASPTVRIRGTGTVYGNANPLYVVDGVWNDDISFLNPNDIENISVLKDASSEAIYGIRAANGVILITTKKGSKNSKATVNYDGFVGSQRMTNEFKMATGPEYGELINELNAASIYPATGPARFPDPSSLGNTDWTRQILRNALITNHNLSINGGGEKSTYSVSFGYLKQNGTVETQSFDRYTMRIKNDFDISNYLKIGYTVAGSMNNSRDINGDIFHQIYSALPIVPVRYADGSYGDPNDFGATSSAMFNPQVTLDYFNQRSKNYRVNGSAYAELKFAKHFTFRTSFGGDYGDNEVVNYAPVYTATFAQRNTVSKLTETNGKTRNWIIENTLTYNNTFGDHNLTVLLGQGAQSYKFNQNISSAENVPDNGNGYYLTQGNNFFIQDIDPGGAYPLYSTVSSYFARVNYSYKGRYLLNATIRGDGSSKFSGNDRWGYFPSIGAGWVISEEDFMKDQHLFNTLKLRGSWGKVGNMGVPPNLSTTTVSQTPAFTYVSGNYVAIGANVNTLTPPIIAWEKGNSVDIGLEASMLDNRLFAEVAYYNKKTVNGIFAIPVLASLGTSGGSIIGNSATFQNKGVEVTLSWKDKIGKDFTYSIGGNIGINKNQVLSVAPGSTAIYKAVSTTGTNNFNTRTVVGQPIGQFFGLQVEGIFQNPAEITGYAKNGTPIQPTAIPGDFKYKDVNNDGVIDDKDRVVLGNPNPKYTYGFNTYFAYKAFDLSADFQGVAGVQIYNANIGSRFGNENFSQDFYNNRWHGEGTSNTYPSAFIAGGQNNRSNSFYVQDGSYFRIRTMQLGYTLPPAISNKLKLQRIRIYANAQNAFNFFKYKGYNPEVGGGPTVAGVDANVYPLYATYNVGVNVTF